MNKRLIAIAMTITHNLLSISYYFINYFKSQVWFLLGIFFPIVLLGDYIPSWYNTIPHNSNSYIGYGSGNSEIEAKANARDDISASISVSIKSTFSKQANSEKGSLTTKIKQVSLQKSNSILNDIKLLKIESHNDKYFVALIYENIPSIDKFIKKLPEIHKNENQNNYIKHTIINKEIRQILDKNINFSLLRKNNHWFIKYKNIFQVLDKKDFERFFKTIKNKSISISLSTSKNTLKEKEQFYFKVQSKQDGFVSILSVYEDGTVSILLKNIEIKKHIEQDLPDKEFEQIPTANLLKANTDTYDLHIAIFSKTRLDLDEFAYAYSDIIQDEKYKNFDSLISYLDNKVFSSIKVITIAKKKNIIDSEYKELK